MSRQKTAFLRRLTVVLVLCGIRPTWSAEAAPMEINDEALAVAKGDNQFATDLYARLRSGQAGNLFFSPYSICAALGMTYAGAAGQTAAEMAQVLRLPLPQEKVPAAFHALGKMLAANDPDAGIQLRVANRLWGQAGFQFRPEFLQVVRENFGAELGQLDFAQAEPARRTINAWIAEQTDHKIENLLAPGVVDANTRLLLTNAIYFKARWEHEFAKAATGDAPFHLSASREVTVSTMHQTHRLRYAAADGLKLLELPYVGAGGLEMLILLPEEVDGLDRLEARLTCENLEKWSSALQSRPVIVQLPKFKVTAEASLADALAHMGMPLAFSDKADFSGMSSQEPLRISAVIHQAFVDVNEEGTEAAAATAVAIRALAVLQRPEPPVEFRADHPFVFLIRDGRTQSILFLGRLVDPRGSK